MAALYTNNASTTLASGITNSATSLTVTSGNGTKFPSPTGIDYFMCTLQGASGTPIEIIKVTARSTDTFTIVRAQEGTTASAFNANDIVELRVTAAEMTQINQLGQGNASIMKNRIINGLMQISQRGTSFTSVGNSGSTPSYTLDRWCGWRGGYAANLDVTQQTGWNAYQYSLRMQRTSGTSSTGAMQMAQIIESINIYDLQGQNVTFSLGIRSGANYSGGQVTAYVLFSTAANQTSLALSAGTWTGVTSVTSNFTITSTGTQYSFSGAVPSGTLSMAVQLSWTPTGTAGTNDYIEFTGVQLEVGSSATGFEYRMYSTEFANCQRYYQRQTSETASATFITGVIASGATAGNGGYQLMCPMRTSPTLDNSAVGGFQFSDGATGTVVTVIGIATSQTNSRMAAVNFTCGGGLTQYRTYRIEANASTTAYLGFSAEL